MIWGALPVFKWTYLHLVLRNRSFHLEGANLRMQTQFVPKIMHENLAIILQQTYYGIISFIVSVPIPDACYSSLAFYYSCDAGCLWQRCLGRLEFWIWVWAPLHSGKHDLVSVVRKIPKMTPTPHALQVGRYEKPMLHLSFSPIQTHLRREVAFTRVWALSKPFMAHLHDDENATFFALG